METAFQEVYHVLIHYNLKGKSTIGLHKPELETIKTYLRKETISRDLKREAFHLKLFKCCFYLSFKFEPYIR